MPPDIGRRIRAALALAGHTSKSLEALLGSGYKDRTIRKLMNDADASREVEHKDLVLLAHHLGVPIEFFTTPDLFAQWQHQPTPSYAHAAIIAGIDENRALISAGIGMLRELMQDPPIPDDFDADWAEVAATARARAAAISRLETDTDTTGNPDPVR
jgi:transcriptional regulator with XRE-family HTH domain